MGVDGDLVNGRVIDASMPVLLVAPKGWDTFEELTESLELLLLRVHVSFDRSTGADCAEAAFSCNLRLKFSSASISRWSCRCACSSAALNEPQN